MRSSYEAVGRREENARHRDRRSTSDVSPLRVVRESRKVFPAGLSGDAIGVHQGERRSQRRLSDRRPAVARRGALAPCIAAQREGPDLRRRPPAHGLRVELPQGDHVAVEDVDVMCFARDGSDKISCTRCCGDTGSADPLILAEQRLSKRFEAAVSRLKGQNL